MGLFDKLKSAIGGIDKASKESPALAGIRELKHQLGMDVRQSEPDRGEDTCDSLHATEDDLTRVPTIPEEQESEQENEMEVDVDEETEPEEDAVNDDEEEVEDDEAAENRAKPVFIIYLKRLKAPLTPSSILSHMDGLSRNTPECLLMRDKAEDPDLAHCFFGAPLDQLVSKALTELESWKEENEEDITPVVDIVTDARAYNCDIDDETFRKVVYYIVNEFGQEAFEVKGNIPYKDSLIRVIEDVNGKNVIKDFLAYPDWTGLDDDDDHWVDRMISEHNISM